MKVWQKASITTAIVLAHGFAPAFASSAHTEAQLNAYVQMARDGQYTEALDGFSSLQKSEHTNIRFWADYLTILFWAGKDDTALQLFREHLSEGWRDLPDYALLPLTRAELAKGDEARALIMLDTLCIRENDDALLLGAEMYRKKGDLKRSDALYQRVLQRGKIAPHKVHSNRALLSMDALDFVTAEEFFQKAIAAAPKEHTTYRREIDALRAGRYTKYGEHSRALLILQPYIDAETQTPHMLADYIMATSLNIDPKAQRKTYENVIRIYRTMVVNKKHPLPDYGLQRVGDAYFRLGKYKEAEAIYTGLLTRGQNDFVLLGRAYAYGMMGRFAESLTDYRQVAKNPLRHIAILYDAQSFLSIGEVHHARAIFTMLGEVSGNRDLWQKRYADSLTAVDQRLKSDALNFRRDAALDGRTYLHEARNVYASLKESDAYRQDAIHGIAVTRAKRGMYESVRNTLATIQDHDFTQKHQEASFLLAKKKTNFLGTFYEAGLDYDHNRTASFGVRYDGYLGNDVYVNAGTARVKMTDGDEHTDYNAVHAGLTYVWDCGRLDATTTHYTNPDAMLGYELSLRHACNDATALIFTTGYRPHRTATAHRLGISEHFYGVRYEARLHRKWTLGAEYQWANMSDGNRYTTYGADGRFIMKVAADHRDAIPFYYSRSGYKSQDTAYNAPRMRESFGAGFSRRWSDAKSGRTIDWTIMLGVGREDGECFGFEPSTQVELIQALPANQSITLGLGYSYYASNQHNDNPNRSKHGYRISLHYNWEW